MISCCDQAGSIPGQHVFFFSQIILAKLIFLETKSDVPDAELIFSNQNLLF